MAGDPTQQYQPVSNDEVATPAPLTTRFGSDVINGANNASWYVCRHKLISEIAAPSVLRSVSSSTAENIIRVFAPRYVAPHFNNFAWRVSSRMHGSAAGTCAWKLYALSRPYGPGASSVVLSTSMLGTSYTTSTVTTSSTSYAQSAVATMGVARTSANDTYFVLTATNSASGASEYGWIVTLDLVPTVE